MKPIFNHPWGLSEKEALALQEELAQKVSLVDSPGRIKTVLGVDVAYHKTSDKLVAAGVLLDAESLKAIETVTAESQVQFPYVPGLFSFRELPPLLLALEKLSTRPDLVVCDGQGYAHPRRFGLACHLGVLFDLPTIGCGKTRLVGEFVPPEKERGSRSPLELDRETIGMALRTQDGINPIYVSVGHKLSLEYACEWVLRLCAHYRLPETTRLADQAVNQALAELSQEI